MAESPRTFISYSHDNPEHRDRVLEMSDELCRLGIDVRLDRYETAPSQGWPRWMDEQIRSARFVLAVCTETYCERAEGRNPPGSGAGANYEGSVISQAIFKMNSINDKFIPVLFDGVSDECRPGFLAPYTFYRWPSGREQLLRRLTGQPDVVKPPLGLPPVLPPLNSRVASVSSDQDESAAEVLVREYGGDVAAPWRQALVVPYSSPKVLFSRATFEDSVRGALLPSDVADQLDCPSLLSLQARALAQGLLWREKVENFPIDRTIAVGFDGSVAARATLWEALCGENPPIWGTDGVAIGSCVDLLIAAIAIADKLMAGAGERLPWHVRVTLSGIAQRHLVYNGVDRRNISTHRSELDDFSESKPLRVDASRAQIIDCVSQMLAELSYQFETPDDSYIRERTESRLAIALPRLVHRFPDGREIARDGDLVAVSRGATAPDHLHPVRFVRGGTAIGDGLAALDTGSWETAPDGVTQKLKEAVLRMLLA